MPGPTDVTAGPLSGGGQRPVGIPRRRVQPPRGLDPRSAAQAQSTAQSVSRVAALKQTVQPLADARTGLSAMGAALQSTMANLAAMKAAQQAKKVKGAGDVIADGIASGIMGAASSVLGRAASQLGVPYVWGGMNPEGNRGGSGEGFDCSGFTSWAYKPTGTTLPHSAAMQLDMTKKSGTLTNRTSQLQPGMLVFFNFGRLAQGVADHVGIYVGNGMVMDASSSNNAIVKRKLSELTGAGTFLGGGFPNKPSKAQVIGRRS